MKMHITSPYGLINNTPYVPLQHKVSLIAHQLGFYEMGIYLFDVSTDTDSELSKRLDGIISSVENDDVVVVQLPTGNGKKYENLLINKILAYSNRKVIIIWADKEYHALYENEFYDRAFYEICLYDQDLSDNAINDILLRTCSAAETKLSIIVKNIDDTLDYILKNNCSVARFGDGEMDLIGGNSIPYQEHDIKLADDLSKIISIQSDEKFIVCLSDVFDHQERYNDFAQLFWANHLKKYYNLYVSLCGASWYGSTFISRPYIDLVDKSISAHYFKKIKKLWEQKALLIVEGKNSRSGVGNDLFSNALCISRIICPSKNAYANIELIYSEILKHAADKLILLMLGPTAKVLAKRLSDSGFQAIDLGHIDSEYEWFKMGATHKIKLNHKHTAEHNFDENIEFVEDALYNSQIVATVE